MGPTSSSVKSTGTNSSNSMVLTTIGLIPKSHAHLIEDGYHLEIQNGRVVKVETATGRLSEDFGGIKTIPLNPSTAGSGGATQPASIGQNLSRSIVPPARAALASDSSKNYTAYAYWKNTTSYPINYFSTTWIVPDTPRIRNDKQTIYIFNGLGSTQSGFADIIQPVLQWGSNGLYGGNYWSVSNFFLWVDASDSTYAAYSNSTTVAPGTNLTGVITYNGSLGYTTKFVGYNDSLVLTPTVSHNGYKQPQHGAATYNTPVTFPNTEFQNYAYETLECYNSDGNHQGFDVNTTGDYPAGQPDVAMTNISLTTTNSAGGFPSGFSWTSTTGVNTYFNEHASVISNSQVNIYFNKAPIISYASPDTLYKSISISTLTPTNSGGPPSTYSVSPSLPAGLSLNSTTGAITGTPTAVSSAANYQITCTNIWGSGTFNLNLTIDNTYPFVVSSASSSSTIYNLVINGNTVTSGFLVVRNDTNNLIVPYTLNSNSTVVFQGESGYMPVGGTLYGNFAPINGTVNTNNNTGLTTITFTGVNLNGAQCWIAID